MTAAKSLMQDIRALENNFWSLWARFGKGPGCVLHETSNVLWFETPIPLLPYNFVLRFSAEVNVDEQIGAIFGAFDIRSVPFLWMIYPSSRPADLDSRLIARGFAEVELIEGTTLSLKRALPIPSLSRDFDILEVGPQSGISQFLDLVFWRWDISHQYHEQIVGMSRQFEIGAPGSQIRCWIARENEVPVAKLLLNCDGESAGIYAVATKPEFRGAGLARALTLTALSAARDAACGSRFSIRHPWRRLSIGESAFREAIPFAFLRDLDRFTPERPIAV